MASPFSWLTKTAAIGALQGRLKSTTFWTTTELWLYIVEALRHWNGLTEQWNAPFNLNNANGQWINTGTAANSPRLRSVTDQYLYGQMCSMLLEPQLSSGAWAGTNQFTLQNLQYSLQKRTQEVIQATSCNIAQLSPINATPGVRAGYTLPDTVLEPRRMRFLALMLSTTGTASSGASTVTVGSPQGIAKGLVMTGTGFQAGTFVTGISGTAVSISLPTSGAVSGTVQLYLPLTLTREDVLAFQSFEPEYLETVSFPQSWAIASEPPLGFDVDLAPTTPGTFDVLALMAGPTFAPPTPSLLGVPDDFSWLPMYGALADVLGMESEATDRERAAYCLQRYMMGLEIMKNSNWLLQTFINGRVADAVSLAETDSFAVGWQNSQSNFPAVVQAGMDFVAPTPNNGTLVSLVLVGNAPLLDSTDTYVQCSRDDFEAILNYSQHLAMFKCAGSEFQSTMPLLNDFYRAAIAVNKRWSTYGIFVEQLRAEGRKQDEADPREPTQA